MPPLASGAYNPQRPRALEMPPPPPISAACAARLFGSKPPTLSSDSAWIDCGSPSSASTNSLSPSVGEGTNGMIGATRDSSSSGMPIQKSMPSGRVISSRKNVPSERPDTRRTISPTVQPKLTMW